MNVSARAHGATDFQVVGAGANQSKIESAGIQEIAFHLRETVPLLDDLFIFTSLKCNKTCHHCYVSSSPLNTTLDDVTNDDMLPIWKDLENLGTRNIYFTGGEPFLIPDILNLIENASQHAPITIYTNASQPLENKLDKLKEINANHILQHGRAILLRVSFDHYDPAIHNIYYGRGADAFAHSMSVSKAASEAGLDIAITTQQDLHNNGSDAYVEKTFRIIFDKLNIVLNDIKVLPDIPAGQHANMRNAMLDSPISSAEFKLLGNPQKNLMCHTGRTLLKINGQMQVFPCTLIIPDTPAAVDILRPYSMGSSLANSLHKTQSLDHPACRAYCVLGKQSCAN